MVLPVSFLSKNAQNNNTFAKKRGSLAFAEIAQHKSVLDY
ncbi:hypothetical protein GXM_04770 [Nostoc sphaeroides CCNUC1]|uniref:Uncharacterized protein n=1 Tax=Nostoc sphaeroides CCNUC1 TaxID=2653204 RepID=A0A5P8W3R2_9NOSO|nr:hypothetical protein GXM_04770 [Nostoc sphaeroides CCNUC1]